MHKRKAISAYENLASAYSTGSFRNDDSKMNHYFNSNDVYDRGESTMPLTGHHVATVYKNRVGKDKPKNYTNDTKTRNYKYNARQMDQDFIADIIEKQYKPIKMFGRRESDISQFSAPVCRDQEHTVRENIQENAELCSCCYDHHPSKFIKRRHLNEIRSVCDTRLYRAKKHSHPKHRRKLFDAYDSELYDLVPVKEKTSPKSRRKFVEDAMKSDDYYKEVPPSPRTLRPRLNLKAQYYTEFEDFMARKNLIRKCSPNKMGSYECRGNFESDESYDANENYNILQRIPIQQNTMQVLKQKQIIQQDNGASSNLHDPSSIDNKQINIETLLNKTKKTDVCLDKTDKTLCEIKSILNNFLQEIKKETTASQYDKSDITSKLPGTGTSCHQQHANARVIPNSGHSFNNHSMAHCGMTSFIPTCTNPCCYPILPVYPMNYMQNGYIVPNPSTPCATCTNNKRMCNESSTTTNKKSADFCSPDTEELIKEIHKYVAQSPRARKGEQDAANKKREAKPMTSRSAGGSTRSSKHDANVGTPKMKCYSKSCEAIGSKMLSGAYYTAINPTCSDTVLEKLSLEATPTDSVSETDFTADIASREKSKQNRFMKVLQSLGIKKKKKDVMEEMSETENSIDVEVKRKSPPFRQEVTNYMMYNQDYYHPPPGPPAHQEHPHEYQGYRGLYYPGVHHQPVQDMSNLQSVHQQTIYEHKDPHCYQTPLPTAPPYSYSYDNYIPPPQNVPLCLKEVEVKSIATQSDRRTSFFNKLKTKFQVPIRTARSEDHPQRNCSTQTSQNKPGLFNWSNMQNKTKNANPMAFSYLKQKQLAEGNSEMRDAMLKKLFYKRNPFSPRNLLVRTLMGKDKSSFGEPPMMYRPKMFF